MKLISVTFHIVETCLPRWKSFLKDELIGWLENNKEIGQYLFTEVQSDLVAEGINFNLLLIFKDEDSRNRFVELELQKILDLLHPHFGSQEVMVFQTFLNQISHRL